MPTRPHPETKSTSADPALIGVDWGTTSFRAYLIGRCGVILDRREAEAGILGIDAGTFATELDRQLAIWKTRGAGLPVLLSGMIGSRQGWVETPYSNLPCGLDTLADQLSKPGDADRAVYLVPGVSRRGPGMPDVMRGEEVQVLGAIASSAHSDGRFVLPGTHCKWVVVRDGRVVDFFTYMTGEVFGACREHTILGRLMTGVGADDQAFRRGVMDGAAPGRCGALLHRLFGTRTYGMFGEIRSRASKTT